MRLFEGTPLQQLQLKFLGIDIPLTSLLTISNSRFFGQHNRTRVKVYISHMSVLRSPTKPPLQDRTPPPPPTYPPPR